MVVRKAVLGRQHAFALFATLIIGTLCLILSVLLSHGTAGGDEGGVLQFLSTYRKGGIAALLAGTWHKDFLAHRLFWLFEKWMWWHTLGLVIPSAMCPPPIYTALMVLDDTLFMVGAFLVMVWHVKRLSGLPLAILATSAVMVASSGIGLFTGGFSECLMCLLVAIICVQLDKARPLSARDQTLLATAGICLLACKLYAAPFVLTLMLLLKSRRQQLVYGTLFVIAPFLWLAAQSEVRASAPTGMMTFYLHLMAGLGFSSILSRVVAFLFSASYGVLPCFPLILIAMFCGRAHHSTLLIKIAAVSTVSAILLCFPFWAGPGGLGGPRYIVPFLIIFIPEVAAGLETIRNNPRTGFVPLIVPIVALLFLPCLEYRNSLITRYAGSESTINLFTDPQIHPAFMAWAVVNAKAAHRSTVVLSPLVDEATPVQDIFPMSALSRVIYVLKLKRSSNKEVETIRTLLIQSGLNHIALWELLRALLIALFLSTIATSAVAFAWGNRTLSSILDHVRREHLGN